MMSFAEVAVDAPAGHSRTFSYSIPSALHVQPGGVVKVPFGPRTLQGIVFALVPTPQVPETRDILGVSDTAPILTEIQLSLARWLSDYYLCTLFEAAALMLPPGGRTRSRTSLSLAADRDVAAESLTPLQARVVEYIRRRGTVEQERLVQGLGLAARGSVNSLVDRGIVLRSTGPRRPPVRTKFQNVLELSPDGHVVTKGRPADSSEEPARDTEWLAQFKKKPPKQGALLERLLTDDTPLPLPEARRLYGAGAVNGLRARGWVRVAKTAVDRDPLAGREFPPQPPPVLTPHQSRAASEVRRALDDPVVSPRVFLLQGVTGSGKTEVYLDAVEHCLSIGKRAIVTVPEISLTPQTVERFAARFPGRVALLHSGMSAGQRHDQWWKVLHGEYGVVIGSRGAVFAPQPDLGLIVEDEEHEWTYKQHDTSPRYHARDAAIKLAELSGATVLLGSASPDLTSYYRALQGEFSLLTLPERFPANGDGGAAPPGAGRLARVTVVDMKEELRDGNAGTFSRELVSSMEHCLDTGGQMILFLNRRGSASFVQCRSCGESVRCRRCEVALTYHRDLERLVCHYCGSRRRVPRACPGCRRAGLGFYGVGTQTVVDEVAQRFPGEDVLRWDRDATRGVGGYEELLERFRSGESRVLVGTQMIAKSLHFPSVTLVGVVAADVGLNVPDYRAAERTFQLLCQVAGRAGRGPAPGKVVVQTYRPESYAIRAGAAQDYGRFYDEELAFRREHADPPFGRLIRLVYADTSRALCEREARRFAGLIGEQRDAWGYSDVECLGPMPAYPARVRGHYRWRIVLRGPDPRTLLDKVTIPRDWLVDIDPITLA